MEMPRLQATAPMARQPVIERMNATVCWAIKALSLSSVATWYESSSQHQPDALGAQALRDQRPVGRVDHMVLARGDARVGQVMVGNRSWVTAASA